MSDAIPEASFRPNNMTKSLYSKIESWKTWRDQVEITMAKKGIRIIAIATGLCADSLFYHFTAEAPRKADKLWRTVACLQTASPLHSSASVPATSLSLKNPLSL